MADQGTTRVPSSKKKPGKVPKGIGKAEREKLKRDSLNDLFLKLADALELSEQNSGKACILGEACRMLKDMLEKVECRRRENAALLSESQYVTREKNELRDENSALQCQIEELKNVLNDRIPLLNLDLNVPPPEHKELDMMPLPEEDHVNHTTLEPALKQPQVVTPVFVFPVGSNFQVFRELDHAEHHPSSKPSVSKPHARYPSPGDSWPSLLLQKQQGLDRIQS